MAVALPHPYIIKPDGSADAVGVQQNFEDLAQGTAALTLIAVTAVNKAAPGNGNVAWTTIDVSAQLPTVARVAVLRIALGGVVANNAGFLGNQVDVRQDAAAQIAASVIWRFANPGAALIGGGVGETVLVPLTAGRTFQYQKTDAINNSSGATIDVLGYST